MTDLALRVSAPGLHGRGSDVTLVLDGEAVPARSTDTVAAALVAAGRPACRIDAGGGERGVFCGMGVCSECLVRVDGVDGVRACVTPVRDGMRVERQPARPVLEPAPAPALAHEEIEADVVVVGAGPAGLAAAAAAAGEGVDVLLVDERGKLGGQYYKQPADALVDDEARLDRQYRAGRALIARVREAGVRVLDGVAVWGAIDAYTLLAAGAGRDVTLRARRLVIATGAYERGVPVPGWTLPGVVTTGAAQTLLRATQVAPGRRVLVSGNGPLNMQLAAELVRAGVTVVALAELARLTSPARAGALLPMLAAAPDLIADGARYQWTLWRHRVPLLTRSALVRVEGDGRVERAVVARIAPDGTPVDGSERSFAVDAVCVGFGFEPQTELARSLGCEHRWNATLRQMTTVAREADGRTSVPHVWVAGDAGGIGGARVAQAVGTLAGLSAARGLRGATTPQGANAERAARRALARATRFQAALWKLYAAPRLLDQLAEPDTLICRCENVRLADLDAAAADGIAHIGAVKRATRAGMGACQGRYCGPLLAEIGARRRGGELVEDDLFAPSAPVKPVTIDALARGAGS